MHAYIVAPTVWYLSRLSQQLRALRRETAFCQTPLYTRRGLPTLFPEHCRRLSTIPRSSRHFRHLRGHGEWLAHHRFVRTTSAGNSDSETLVRTPIVHGGQGASKDESQHRADFTQRHPESPRLNRHFAVIPHRHSPSSPIVCTE